MPATSRLETADEFWSRYQRFATEQEARDPQCVADQRLYCDRLWKDLQVGETEAFIGALNVTSIERFCTAYANSHGPGSWKNMHKTLRALLRFCLIRGDIDTDLRDAVPALHQPRLSTVPRAMPEWAIEGLLSSIDRSRPTGKRDFAIILMLCVYGLRAAALRRLCCEDIDWHGRTIFFPASKGGKDLRLPLTDEVAKGLLDYLRAGRAKSSAKQLFVSRNGGGPLSTLSVIIRRHLKRAKITLPEGVSQGTHGLRHAFAQRMLDNELPFKHIQDAMGHRHIDSTFVYTKVDYQKLRLAVCEWPLEVS